MCVFVPCSINEKANNLFSIKRSSLVYVGQYLNLTVAPKGLYQPLVSLDNQGRLAELKHLLEYLTQAQMGMTVAVAKILNFGAEDFGLTESEYCDYFVEICSGFEDSTFFSMTFTSDMAMTETTTVPMTSDGQPLPENEAATTTEEMPKTPSLVDDLATSSFTDFFTNDTTAATTTAATIQDTIATTSAASKTQNATTMSSYSFPVDFSSSPTERNASTSAAPSSTAYHERLGFLAAVARTVEETAQKIASAFKKLLNRLFG